MGVHQEPPCHVAQRFNVDMSSFGDTLKEAVELDDKDGAEHIGAPPRFCIKMMLIEPTLSVPFVAAPRRGKRRNHTGSAMWC